MILLGLHALSAYIMGFIYESNGSVAKSEKLRTWIAIITIGLGGAYIFQCILSHEWKMIPVTVLVYFVLSGFGSVTCDFMRRRH